jgi:hypothetical protein
MELDIEPRSRWPRHSAASREALQIMQRMLRQANFESFRPDLAKATSWPPNTFLYNLATRIFMTLVASGEYERVTLEMCDRSMARTMIYNHVYNTLMKR